VGAVAVAGACLAACSAAPAPRSGPVQGPGTSTTASHSGGRAPTSSTSTSAATGTGREGIPAFSHLFVVVMENEERQGALATPQVATLARRYASAGDWYAVAHPSLPNYLAMVSGSTWGVTSDCSACDQPGPDLGAQLSAAGITWGAYMEGLPRPCFLGAQSADGSYADKHDPFVYFTDVRSRPAVCSHVQPYASLRGLLSPGTDAARVPRFVWVTPDLCDDGHNCGPSVSGPWLAAFVASVTASPAWADGGALVVTWDEGADADDRGIDPATGKVQGTGGGGNVLTLVIAPGVPAGRSVGVPYDHYSLLRTVEDAFGLPLLGAAASPGTTPLSAFWAGPATTAGGGAASHP